MTTILPQLCGDDTALKSVLDKTAETLSKNEVYLPGEEPQSMGHGDSLIDHDFLTQEEAQEAFENLKSGGEIQYQQWYHMNKRKNKPLQPLTRIKVAQSRTSENGLTPYYRFPVNDQQKYGITEFSPTIDKIQRKLTQYMKEKHPQMDFDFNHAVVLLYRNGEDRIGFHKDKTLDLDVNAPIVSISLGASRQYVIQDDINQPTQREEVTLTPGTLFALGAQTNLSWYHSIREMPGLEKERVSITFRAVTTFRDANGVIEGQGDSYQTSNWPTELRGSHRIEDSEENL